MSKPSPFTIAEADAAKSIGLSRETIRQLRETALVRGIDWAIDRGKVMLTQEGVDQIARHAKNAPAAASLAPGPPQPPIEQPIEVELTVVRANLVNWHVLEAVTADGARVTVRTTAQTPRSASNFIPGMKIRAHRTESEIYQQVGRAPRYRGRW